MQFTLLKRLSLSALFFLTIGISTGKSEDQRYRHELGTGLSFVRFNLTTETGTQYSFSQSYSYSVTRLLQLGAQVGVADSGAQIDSFQLSFFSPVTFNFGGTDLRTDYFVRLSPGVTYRNLWSPALQLQLGKRFQLFENVVWRPTVGVKSEFLHGDPRVAIDLIPFNLGIIF